MDESLLQKGAEAGRGDDSGLTWGVFFQEVTRMGFLAGPMVAVIFSQSLLQVISLMMVGHLDELALSSTAIAVSFCGVTGFSLLLCRYGMLYKSTSDKIPWPENDLLGHLQLIEKEGKLLECERRVTENYCYR